MLTPTEEKKSKLRVKKDGYRLKKDRMWTWAAPEPILQQSSSLCGTQLHKNSIYDSTDRSSFLKIDIKKETKDNVQNNNQTYHNLTLSATSLHSLLHLIAVFPEKLVLEQNVWRKKALW